MLDKTNVDSVLHSCGLPAHASLKAWRRRVYEIIEIGQGDDRASRIVDAGIIGLILLNIAAFVAETVPELAARYGSWFHAFEACSVAIFTIEYAARLWTAVEVPFLARLPPWKSPASSGKSRMAADGAAQVGHARLSRHRSNGHPALLSGGVVGS